MPGAPGLKVRSRWILGADIYVEVIMVKLVI